MRFILQAAVATALLAQCSAAVRADEHAPDPGLTVGQVINVLGGLTALSQQTPDKDGKPQYYRLSGDVRILVALNIDLASRIQTSFQKTTAQMVFEMSGGGSKVPDDKLGEFNQQVQKMLDTPSGVRFTHLKPADLCLDMVPDKCPVANQIPPNVLAQIFPILDR